MLFPLLYMRWKQYKRGCLCVMTTDYRLTIRCILPYMRGMQYYAIIPVAMTKRGLNKG